MGNNGWIAVDFDGTLVEDTGWKDGHHIGRPILPMIERVAAWLEQGKDVRIFTARVAASGMTPDTGPIDCDAFAKWQREKIEQWCLLHFEQVLPVTATKDFRMLELWDDRAVQVVRNTGRSLREDIIHNMMERGNAGAL